MDEVFGPLITLILGGILGSLLVDLAQRWQAGRDRARYGEDDQ